MKRKRRKRRGTAAGTPARPPELDPESGLPPVSGDALIERARSKHRGIVVTALGRGAGGRSVR